MPRLPSEFSTEPKISTYNAFTSELIKRLSEIREIAGENLIKPKETTNRYYNKSSTFLRKSRRRSLSEKEVRKGKSDSQYHSPYTIVKLTDRNNVILEASDGRLSHKHTDTIKLAYEQRDKGMCMII